MTSFAFLLESWTFEIAENPAIAEKIQFLELSTIAGFYCTLILIVFISKGAVFVEPICVS